MQTDRTSPRRSPGPRAAPPTRRYLRIAVAVTAILWLPACYTVGPDYVPPEPDVPDAWHEAVTDGLQEGKTNLHTWWTLLEDPILNDLIRQAAAANLDLKAAMVRIYEAQAQRGVSAGSLYPQVDASGVAEKRRISSNSDVIGNRTVDTYSLGLDATWEIDFWGRVRRSVESADASLQATVENYRDILVLLFAEVAATYVEVRALQTRIEAAEANVKAQSDTLKLTADRFKAGLSPKLDVAQANLNLASSESVIPALHIGLYSAINRLAVLVGEYPGAVSERLIKKGPVPTPPEKVTIGFPAELLRQRPDIRRAERELAAQTARIGVVTAELYPQFGLGGSIGLSARNSGDLISGNSTGWSIGPNFRWNLFNGGRIRSAIKVEDARTEQALLFYENTVLQAVEDVENAIIAYKREQIRRAALERAVNAADETVRLVMDLYKTGVTDFQNVLDAERSQFARQDELAESTGQVAKNLVNLYRALGGGWDPEAPAPGSPTDGTEPPKAEEKKS